MPVESLEFDEKPGIGKIAVEHPHGIVGVERDLEVAADVLDRPHDDAARHSLRRRSARKTSSRNHQLLARRGRGPNHAGRYLNARDLP